MKKFIIIGITIVIVLSLVIILSFLLLFNSNSNLKGIESQNLIEYSTATNTSVVCSGATSTLILAATTIGNKYTFELTVASSTSITFCKKATGCVLGNGLTIASTTGSYREDDNYYGAYSCIGNSAVSSTVGLIYK